MGIVTANGIVIAVMGFKKKGKATVGYKKKYEKHSKRGRTAANSVPRIAESQSKKKYKPCPTNMLSDPDSLITPFQRRMMIGGHFLKEGAPMRSEWYGNDGTISKTLTLVGLTPNPASRRLIARVFAEVEDCVYNNTDYAGDTKQDRQGRSHRPPVISLDDDPIVNMIADCIENGFGLQNTTRHVNSHLTESGRATITVSAVYGCIQRLKPKIIKTKTRQQGSTNINSNWAKARLNWVLQL